MGLLCPSLASSGVRVVLFSLKRLLRGCEQLRRAGFFFLRGARVAWFATLDILFFHFFRTWIRAQCVQTGISGLVLINGAPFGA